jgi:hypothetical protein
VEVEVEVEVGAVTIVVFVMVKSMVKSPLMKIVDHYEWYK